MTKDRRTIPYIIASLLLAFAPFYLNRYQIDVLNTVGLYALLGLSLNLIVGHAGLFNLGHAAFYAVGAYTAAILNTRYGVSILWLLPVSGLAAGVFAAVIARPIIHLRGDYLCMVTIGVGEIVRIALINDIFGLTGGSNGIFGIARPKIFGYVIRTPHQFLPDEHFYFDQSSSLHLKCHGKDLQPNLQPSGKLLHAVPNLNCSIFLSLPKQYLLHLQHAA